MVNFYNVASVLNEHPWQVLVKLNGSNRSAFKQCVRSSNLVKKQGEQSEQLKKTLLIVGLDHKRLNRRVVLLN